MELNSQAGIMYAKMRENMSMAQVESLCRQILTYADREYLAECERLSRESDKILRERKERESLASTFDAPGVIV